MILKRQLNSQADGEAQFAKGYVIRGLTDLPIKFYKANWQFVL